MKNAFLISFLILCNICTAQVNDSYILFGAYYDPEVFNGHKFLLDFRQNAITIQELTSFPFTLRNSYPRSTNSTYYVVTDKEQRILFYANGTQLLDANKVVVPGSENLTPYAIIDSTWGEVLPYYIMQMNDSTYYQIHKDIHTPACGGCYDQTYHEIKVSQPNNKVSLTKKRVQVSRFDMPMGVIFCISR
jgi:hypothetical protein